MKRSLALALILALFLSLSVPALAFTAQRSAQNLSVDGQTVACEKYNIDGSNYFKLRDLAQLLNGTGSQFDVGWDEANGVVSVTTQHAYTTPNGHELEVGADKSATAQPSVQTIMIDGAVRRDLTVYNIGGSNFFKLREMGYALGFDVDYDPGTNTAIVRSREAGSEPGPTPVPPTPGPEPAGKLTLERLQGVWYASGVEDADGNRFEAELIVSGKTYTYAYSSPDLDYFSLIAKTIDRIDSETNTVWFSEYHYQIYDGRLGEDAYESDYFAGNSIPAEARSIRYAGFTADTLDNGHVRLQRSEYSTLSLTVERILKAKKEEAKDPKSPLTVTERTEIARYAGMLFGRIESGRTLLLSASKYVAAAAEETGAERDKQLRLAQEAFSAMQDGFGASRETVKNILAVCKNKNDAGRIVFDANELLDVIDEITGKGAVSAASVKRCTELVEQIDALVTEIRDIARNGVNN